jgi:hypothetical protein
LELKLARWHAARDPELAPPLDRVSGLRTNPLDVMALMNAGSIERVKARRPPDLRRMRPESGTGTNLSSFALGFGQRFAFVRDGVRPSDACASMERSGRDFLGAAPGAISGA